jgi:NTE family protein
VFYRELVKVGMGVLQTQVYAGGSLEAGNTFNEEDAFSVDALRSAGSIFLGADTVIGPVYLACGFTEGGRRRYYFSIGQSF